RQWRDVISGEAIDGAPPAAPNRIALANSLKHFPVALLYHEETMGSARAVEETVDGTRTQQPA
ncbi:MAG TPA: hypothetical protein VIE90_16880, partial [Candidatus Binatia bacterium]